MIAILGSGTIGSALAVQWARRHADVVLPATEHDTAALARPDADWIIATKGWDPDTLRSPSEVVAAVLGDSGRVVSLGGPALAAEIVAGAPTALVAAAADLALAERVAASLRSTMLGVGRPVPDRALRAIGSTVEGVANTTAAPPCRLPRSPASPLEGQPSNPGRAKATGRRDLCPSPPPASPCPMGGSAE